MNIASLIGITAVVTEFIKKALLKIKVEVKGSAAVALAVIVSAAVVVVEVFKTEGTFGIGTIWIFVQVVIGSTIGYSILTKKSG
jgi:hypothetical protein